MCMSHDLLDHLLASLFRALAEVVQIVKGGPKLDSEGCAIFVF